MERSFGWTSRFRRLARERIRRMGMERILGQLDPKVLDTERREVGGECRLLAVEMNHGKPWRFLQMVD